jgi:hypothetical protein
VFSHDFDDITRLGFRYLADINHDLVHGDATKHRAEVSIIIDLDTFFMEESHVAVSVSDADCSNTHRSVRLELLTVRHAVMRGQSTDDSETRFEDESRFEFVP